MRLFVGLMMVVGCGDDAAVPRDAGDPRQCGPVVCGEGMVCCNASCGICIAPGGSCTGERCIDAGAPRVDAAGVDAAGIDAAGIDAGGTDGGNTACTAASECATGTYCHRPSGMCTAAGICEATPAMCTEECPGVCGCDGVTYCSECAAGLAGASVASMGSCAPRDCEPPDARAEGICRTTLGFVWTGGECAELTGCTCTGRGCADLYPDQRLCEDAYAARCRPPRFMCGLRSCLDTEYCSDRGCTRGPLALCRTEPAMCTMEYRPEVGCNDVRYRNACWANRDGVDVR
jgi:hypothetical protein